MILSDMLIPCSAFNEAEQDVIDSLAQIVVDGMPGLPLPYTLRSDGFITLTLFLCFLLISYTLRNGKKDIFQYVKLLFRNKDRASLFDEASKPNSRYILTLTAVTCILSGICIFHYLVETFSETLLFSSSWLLLIGYIGGVIAFLLLKWGTYNFINWIFFDKSQCDSWQETYLGLIGIVSFVLFPLVSLIVFFEPDLQNSLHLLLPIIAFAKILLFYKCMMNFFYHFYGTIHLILYFCALEVMPIFLLWRGIAYLNYVLI